MTEALEAAGICPIKEYIWRRQAATVGYIVNFSIYELCTMAERITGSSISIQWWYQELNL